VVTDIRASILRAARSDGLVIEDGDVHVSANPASVHTTVKWSYRLVTYRGWCGSGERSAAPIYRPLNEPTRAIAKRTPPAMIPISAIFRM
jgi:hypothetical protein